MSNVTSFPEEPRSSVGHAAARALAWFARPDVLALLLLAVLTVFRVQGTVDQDTSWQLWVADRMHHGARLYSDIMETNPPLWFWMALPVDSLAKLLGVRSDALMILAVAAAAALSLVATGRLLTHVSAGRRSLLLTFAALILFGMPWMHVGQREHLALLGAVPYAALIAARYSGRPVSPKLAFAIGAGAALGFALKHYFLLAPVLLELWLQFGQRRRSPLFRPEIIALLTVGGAYACAVLIWARDFLTVGVPLLRLAYGSTGATRFIDLFQPPIWIALLLLVALALNYRRFGKQAPFATALLIAGIAFAADYFIQGKGWLYHAIPLVGCLSLALASLLAELPEVPRSLRLIAPALLVLPVAVAAQEQRAAVEPNPELVRSIAGLPPGTKVGFIATDLGLAWSVTYQHHLGFASRYNGFWMLRAIVRNEERPDPDPRLLDLHRRIVAQTVVDFECAQPPRAIISRPSPDGSDRNAFDILPFFLNDPAFAAMFKHYRSIWRGPGLDVYQLSTPLPRPAPAACRRGV
jgi:hypothetical protein